MRRGANVRGAAEKRLKNFRQASVLAVAITGFILLLLTPGEAGLLEQETEQTEQISDTVATINEIAVDDLQQTDTAATVNEGPSTKESADEAIGALQDLWEGFLYNLPKIFIALIALLLAWLFARLVKMLLQKLIGNWHSSNAIITMATIAVWLFSIGIAFSVVAGDIRALVGSFGLIGLALSWSLQTPIESFTGWLLNSFQGYYRVGDRIRVGDVFGDVYRIDFLTTTVWEIGGPYQSGFVQAEQPTGRMVTFPNNEILSGTVINLTGDFPYVWDELAVAVANESDMQLAMEVLERVALELLGNYMIEPARTYALLLQKVGLHDVVTDKPQVFLSMDDSWSNITIRYLVGARERRKWKSELTIRITKELNKEVYLHKIIPVYPRQQVQFINPDGRPVDASSFRNQDEA
ncbi:mechanosensitive ion channel protein MscS [Pontibacter sp. SGAir0037]|nr:mechanosensitive ion channel protein MscS [Pontibacter sp. SGAir0037]